MRANSHKSGGAISGWIVDAIFRHSNRRDSSTGVNWVGLLGVSGINDWFLSDYEILIFGVQENPFGVQYADSHFFYFIDLWLH